MKFETDHTYRSVGSTTGSRFLVIGVCENRAIAQTFTPEDGVLSVTLYQSERDGFEDVTGEVGS